MQILPAGKRFQLDRRSFIGGSDARIIMGDDESALFRLWREKRGETEPEDLSGRLQFYLRFEGRALRNRTPAPPPFSSINSIPTASSAFCSFARASSDTRGPNPASRRLTVGRESPAREASSV
jgi:hypothetical protein